MKAKFIQRGEYVAESAEVIYPGSEGIHKLLAIKLRGTTMKELAWVIADGLAVCFSLRDLDKWEPLEVEFG